MFNRFLPKGLLIAVLIAFAFRASGQQAVRGRVMLADGPATGAIIRLTPTDVSQLADSLGNFIFDQVPAGSYELRISMVGAAAITRKIQVNRHKATELGSMVFKNRSPCD